mmetsp:Transcript_16015/g.27254  ORF Transcript_16015/g.27254 Transcript_16015/m.27254 type:complete len:319 (-) Transcript_16015:491-1447(-)
MRNANNAQPSSDTVVVTYNKGRAGSSSKMEALKTLLTAVIFIGGFAFNSLVQFDEPVVDGDPFTRAIIYLSLLFLVAASAILLYTSVIGTIIVALYYRLLSFDGQFRRFVSEKMDQKFAEDDYKIFQFSSEDWSNSHQTMTEYGRHTVTCIGMGAKTDEEKEKKIKDLKNIVQEIVWEIYYGNSTGQKPLAALTLRYGNQNENVRKFKNWKKSNENSDEQFQAPDTLQVVESDFPHKCLWYGTPIQYAEYLFWQKGYIRHCYTLFPCAIVLLFVGQGLRISASYNWDAVVIAILTVILGLFFIFMVWSSMKLLNVFRM